MNDLDICKRIAEIEGLDICDPKEWYYPEGCALILVDECSEEYNPLTDDALCFQLMVKYKVDFCNLDNDVFEAINGSQFFQNRNPNKAICLAIIEANK